MKRLLLTAVLVSITTLGIYSCNKGDKPASKTTTAGSCSNPNQTANKTAGTDNYKVHCIGNCAPNQKCALQGVIDGKNTYVQCHCDKCKMEVETSKYINDSLINAETTTLPNGQTEVYFWQSFVDYMESSHPGQVYTISGVEIWDDREDQDNYVITYTYELESGSISTISYQWDRTQKTTQQVDCKGTCDCRERYFPATGALECTCTNTCSMTITKLAANAWNPLIAL
jgi:hypothetical protein